MLIRHIISEIRREPDKNPKLKTGHEGAIEYLQSLSPTQLSKVGVSMTEIDKLGINPRSRHKTPIGIYFYPADYYLHTKRNLETLPYQEDVDYIQIFTWNTDRILDISNLTEDGYKYELNILTKTFGHDYLEDLAQDQKPLVDSPGGRLWMYMWLIANDGPNPHVFWNKIIKDILKYDMVTDFGGKSIIHENEPYQGVVINPRVIRVLDRIPKKYHTTTKPHRQWSKHEIYLWILRNRKPVSPAVEQIIEKDADLSHVYLIHAKPGWKPGENAIVTYPRYAFSYANSYKGPWPEAERFIATTQELNLARTYAKYVLKDPDPETWAARYRKQHNLPEPKGSYDIKI